MLTLHLSLVVNNDASIVFKVDEHTILPPVWFPLPNDDSRHDFLPQLGLALLDCGHNHVTSACSWESVQPTLDAIDGYHVEVLGSCVVGAVNDCTNRKTERNAEFRSRCSTTSCKRKAAAFNNYEETSRANYQRRNVC